MIQRLAPPPALIAVNTIARQCSHSAQTSAINESALRQWFAQHHLMKPDDAASCRDPWVPEVHRACFPADPGRNHNFIMTLLNLQAV
jgi:hypothetical protein